MLEEAPKFRQWEESCLENFSKFLGFPVDGFQEQIPELVQRIDARRKKGKAKECLTLTKFDWELKKFEWSLKGKGGKNRGDSGRGTRGYFQ